MDYEWNIHTMRYKTSPSTDKTHKAPNLALETLKNAPRYRVMTDSYAAYGYYKGDSVIHVSAIGINEADVYVSADIATLCKDYELVKIDGKDIENE